MTVPPSDVAARLHAAPPAARDRLMAIRALIFAAAKAEDVGPLEETLKWGEPAYLPRRPRIGTTLRLGWSDADPVSVALFVPCQTRLIDLYRARFPEGFHYDGNRAVRMSVDATMREAEVQQMAAMALTYHRDNRRNA